ncbi:hypothetical protein AB4Z46_30770 [Variovorax sp. M-6]|uniref:hypothetical protein n=1 Tax=Variovorax sp. M-6 TaxID=3233041 RepID=UPI003F99CCD1
MEFGRFHLRTPPWVAELTWPPGAARSIVNAAPSPPQRVSYSIARSTVDAESSMTMHLGWQHHATGIN